MMEQSNHILESNTEMPVGEGLNPSGDASRSYFTDERNTMMAGDLRD